MITNFLTRAKDKLEFLGGVSEEPPQGAPRWMQAPIFWGIWWAVLILLVLSFSGQTSKFIYIDF